MAEANNNTIQSTTRRTNQQLEQSFVVRLNEVIESVADFEAKRRFPYDDGRTTTKRTVRRRRAKFRAEFSMRFNITEWDPITGNLTVCGVPVQYFEGFTPEQQAQIVQRWYMVEEVAEATAAYAQFPQGNAQLVQ